MNTNLRGKTAVVCGSTQGIGKACAIELAKLGASVVLVARNLEKLLKVKEELDTSKGQNHHQIAVDFSFPPEVGKLMDDYIELFGHVHILVNNTGGPKAGKAIDAKPEEFLHAFNMHLLSNHYLVQSVVPGMKKEKYGRIINIISTSVKQPLDNLGVSNTIRGAVANWAKTLANELGEYNITVNNVLPGATNTSRLKEIIENKAQKTGLLPSKILEQMSNIVPMKRIGEPEEVAQAVAFLASPAASYINGVNLPVDGGRTKSL